MKSYLLQMLAFVVRLGSLIRRAPGRDVWTFAAAVVIVLLLELLGRQYRSEGVDAAAAALLAMLAMWCLCLHQWLRIGWTRWLRERAAGGIARLRAFQFEWGLDLRGRPPVPPGLPLLLAGLPLALSAVFGLLYAWSSWTLAPWRILIVPVSYVAYLSGLIALWAGLVGAIAVMVFVPMWVISDAIVTHLPLSLRREKWAIRLAKLAYLGVTSACYFWLAPWCALTLLSLATLCGCTQLYLVRTPGCVWRGRTSPRVFSLPIGTLLCLQSVAVPLGCAVLVLLALGPEVLGGMRPQFDAPISRTLGLAAAWLSACGLAVFFAVTAGHLGLMWWRNPDRSAPTTVHISGVASRSVRRRLLRQCASAGFRVRFVPQPPGRADQLLFWQDGDSAATGPASDRPRIALSQSSLDDPQFCERLERRDSLQRRRVLLRGLQSIFRRAARVRSRAGCGYWVAPHLWFVGGLTRDAFDDEDTEMFDVIPPLYHHALPLAVRQHFFAICSSLEIDLIFLEDGVGFTGLRRVLRVMFERYDVDGGEQPLREVHFSGLPKIRVMIHDHTLDEQLLESGYPEPDYRQLGRVRILHIFRDRGDEEEQSVTPSSPDQLLIPSLS